MRVQWKIVDRLPAPLSLETGIPFLFRLQIARLRLLCTLRGIAAKEQTASENTDSCGAESEKSCQNPWSRDWSRGETSDWSSGDLGILGIFGGRSRNKRARVDLGWGVGGGRLACGFVCGGGVVADALGVAACGYVAVEFNEADGVAAGEGVAVQGEGVVAELEVGEGAVEGVALEEAVAAGVVDAEAHVVLAGAGVEAVGVEAVGVEEVLGGVLGVGFVDAGEGGLVVGAVGGVPVGRFGVAGLVLRGSVIVLG